MQPSQTFPVLSFLGVVVQFAGAVMLIGLFLMLRRFAPRRAYFAAWTTAWALLALAILALVVRYVLVPEIVGRSLDDAGVATRGLYLFYQLGKALAFVFFIRGTLMYVAGATGSVLVTRRLWLVAALFAAVSTLAVRHGLDEMVIWQSAIAVPALGYCASALLWLPGSRRTAGSAATGACFALVATLWLIYAGAFALAIHNPDAPLARQASVFVRYNGYFDLTLDTLLGYAMILLLMEDAKREVDDAHEQLRLTHDQLRRAALYDSLTDSLNRRAFAEGVGLDMVRATFGTVVLADLDNLKLVNDRFGHAVGDQLIRRCADVLRTTLRSSDKLYRWGGDEFLLIVPSAHEADVLERLQLAIAEAAAADAEIVAQAGDGGESPRAIVLQVSLGAADYASSEELTAAIERADRAMYLEKSRRKADPRSAGTFGTAVAGSPEQPSPTSVAAVR